MKSIPYNPADTIIVAADVRDGNKALSLAEELMPLCKKFKVGHPLICNAGFGFIDDLLAIGASVLVDLKFHDIPNTVYEASLALARKGIWAFTMHASGGVEMMQACVSGAKEGAKSAHLNPPISFAVTLLTSISQEQLNNELLVKVPTTEYVVTMAKLARQAGADGVVASGMEVSAIRESCGDELLILVPGVRPSWADLDEQRRHITPSEAIKRGANYIVIGRPILKSENRLEALKRIIDEITSAL